MELILPAYQYRLIDRWCSYTFPSWRWQGAPSRHLEGASLRSLRERSWRLRSISHPVSREFRKYQGQPLALPARRVFICRKSVHKSGCFRASRAVKYGNRCESDGGAPRVNEDKSERKKARAYPYLRKETSTPCPCGFEKVIAAITRASCLPSSATSEMQSWLLSEKFEDFIYTETRAACWIANSLNKYISQFLLNFASLPDCLLLIYLSIGIAVNWLLVLIFIRNLQYHFKVWKIYQLLFYCFIALIIFF